MAQHRKTTILIKGNTSHRLAEANIPFISANICSLQNESFLSSDIYVHNDPTKETPEAENMRGRGSVRDLISLWNNMEGRMDEEGSGSKRSSTLPVPNPKPRPLPRPQGQVKTLASNTNRSKAVSAAKPSLPPKPRQSSSSALSNATTKAPPKPARQNLNKNRNNNNVIQSSTNAGLKNRTLDQISESVDGGSEISKTNGFNGNTELQNCKDSASATPGVNVYDRVGTVIESSPCKGELPKGTSVNGTTKEPSNLRTKPLPPRKPLPDLPGKLDVSETDSDKKPPRPYKPPEIAALSKTAKSSGSERSQSPKEDGKSGKRKISAPLLAPSSSPHPSPQGSPQLSPRQSRQTLPANFEATVVPSSTGLYEIVDTIDKSTTISSTKPTGNQTSSVSMLPTTKTYNKPASSSDKRSIAHSQETKPNLASEKKASAYSSYEKKTKSSPPRGKKETSPKASDKKGSTTSLDKKIYASSYSSRKISPSTNKGRNSSSPDKKEKSPPLEEKAKTSMQTSPKASNKKGSTTSLDKKIYASSYSSRKTSPSTNKERNSSPPDKKEKSPPLEEKGSTTSLDKKIHASNYSSRKISPPTNKGRNSSPPDKKEKSPPLEEKAKTSMHSTKKTTASTNKTETNSSALKKSGSASSLSKNGGTDRSKTPSPILSKREKSGSLPTEARKLELSEMEKDDANSKENVTTDDPKKERKISLDSQIKASSSPPSDKKAMTSFDKTKISIRSSYRKISNSLLPDKQKSTAAPPESTKPNSLLSSDKTAIAKELEQAIGKTNPGLVEKKSSSKESEQPPVKPASSPLSRKKESAAASTLDNVERAAASSQEKPDTSSSSKKKTEKQSRSSKLFSRLTSLSMKPRSAQVEKPLRRSHSTDNALETLTDPKQEATSEGGPTTSTSKSNLAQQPIFQLQAADYKLKPVGKVGMEQTENEELAEPTKTRKMPLGTTGSKLGSVAEGDEGHDLKSPSDESILPLQELPDDEKVLGRANSFGSAVKPASSSKKSLRPSSSFEAKQKNVKTHKRSNSLGNVLDSNDAEDSEEKTKVAPKKTSVALKPNFSKPLRPHSMADILKPVSNFGKRSKEESQSKPSKGDVKEDRNAATNADFPGSVKKSEITSTNSAAAPKFRPFSVGDFSKLPSNSAKDTTSKVYLKRASLSVDSANLSTKLHAVAVDISISSDDSKEEIKGNNQTDSNVLINDDIASQDLNKRKEENLKSDSSSSAVKSTEADLKEPDIGIDDRSEVNNTNKAILPKKPDLVTKSILTKENIDKETKQPSRPDSLALKPLESCSFDEKLDDLENNQREPASIPVKPATADKPKWSSRTADSKALEEEDSQEVIDSGHENVDRKLSQPRARLATRSRRLPPPTGPAPSAPAPKADSPDASRRPAPPPPSIVAPTEVKRLPDRSLPAVPEAPRPRSVYEDIRSKTSPEARSSSMNNVSDISADQGESMYTYAYGQLSSSPEVQRKTVAPPASKAAETSYEYTTPDASVESLKNKPNRVRSSGEYEIKPEETACWYTTVDPAAVDKLISSVKTRQEVSESSGETTTSTSVTDYEKSREQSTEENSSESSDEGSEYLMAPRDYEKIEGESDSDSFTDGSQSSHDYLDPPPVPTPQDSLSQVKTWEESNKDVFGEDGGDEDGPLEEPLYQVYTAATLARERNISRKSVSSDNSESTVEEYTKGTMQNMRMLWCQLPEVVASGILDKISENERKRQEAMFEVITSEASYIKSLGILINHFMDKPEMNPNCPECVLEKSQYRILFSNVKAIKEMSERFLEELRTRQKEKVLISTISDIIYKYVCKHFEVYVKYCSNQVYQERMVKSLREKNPRFVEVCSKLEKQQAVQSLNLPSFLVLPMQRITRFPLLVDAICHRCEGGSEEFRRTDAALSEVNKVVKDCNEGARKMERMEEMCMIQGQIEFKTKPIALVTSTRYLLRRGDLMFVQESEYRTPLRKGKLKIKPTLKPTYLFLFSDLVLIAKKKSEKSFKVLDYATRSMTQVENTGHRNLQCNHMFSLIFLENSEGKTKDYLLSASNETDKTRWIVAFKPPSATKEGELAVYDSWDCPQVQAIHNYNAQQPDELTLHEGDVINVLRKLTDGWYHGERLCDCAQGWFPANHTEAILNEHVRRRNLLQRYRLLAASQHLMGTFMNS